MLIGSRFAGPALVVVLACIALGCSEAPEDSAWVVRDSADVRVVENLRPAWGEDDAWSVAEAPSLEIGVEDGEEPYMFFRALDALRLADGRIVVTNQGTGELRFFDHEGAFLYSVGRHGKGPGEFGEFSMMRLWQAPRGDALVVSDDGNARVNLFRSSGEPIASVSVEPLPGWSSPRPMNGFADGSWLTVTGSALFGRGNTGLMPRDTLRYFRYNADGRPGDVLVRVPSRPAYRHVLGSSTHFPLVPLHAAYSVAAGSWWLFVGDGATPQIERRRLDGTLNSLIRWSDGQRRRSDDVYERYKVETLAQMSEAMRPLYADYFELELPIPEFLPLFQGVFEDDEGYVWVEYYRLPWETEPRWEVFDPDGRWLGRIATPQRFSPYQIGRDFILGLHRDDMDVERIQLYKLIKPPPTG